MSARGVVGGNYLGYQVADVLLPVVVGGFHQALELGDEGVLVELQGTADVDQLVPGAGQALLVHEALLVELLSGAEAGVDDLYVHVRLVAGQQDHVPGQFVDLDRGAHVQDEYMPSAPKRGGGEDQGRSLRDGHEVPDDIRVGHGDGPACGDLFAEAGDHGTVAPQHVAEPDGHELCGGPVGDHQVVDLLPVGPGVGVQVRQLRGAALLDLPGKGLDDHLAQPLAGPHDVHGVDGFVRGDQDELAHAVSHGGEGRVVGPDGVVLDGLAGAVLHQRHVLVGGRVEDDVRAVVPHHLFDAAAVADRSDEHHQIQIRVLVGELQLDGMGVVLVDVEYDQPLQVLHGGYLAAELAADASASAGNEDGLPLQGLPKLPGLHLDGLPAKQILYLDLLQVADGHLAEGQLIYARQGHELAVGHLADVQDLLPLLSGDAGQGHVDLADAVLLYGPGDLVSAAHHFHVVDGASPLVLVVVDETPDLVGNLRGPPQFPKEQGSGGACAHDHGVVGILLVTAVPKQEHKTIGEPDAYDQHELDDDPDDVVGNGHTLVQQGDPYDVKDPRDDSGHGHPL